MLMFNCPSTEEAIQQRHCNFVGHLHLHLVVRLELSASASEVIRHAGAIYKLDYYYVAAKATYIGLLLWQNGGFSALAP